MGRKIPGHKHKGVKDPLAYRARLEAKLKDKINCPPARPDEQEIPRSWLNIMRLKKLVEDDTKVVRKRKRNKASNKFIQTSQFASTEITGTKKGDKLFPSIIQRIGESNETFMNRVDEATDDFVKEAQFESQFGVQVKHNEKGEVDRIEMAEPDEFELSMQQQKNNRRRRKPKKPNSGDGNDSEEQQPNRNQRRKLKMLAEKNEKLINDTEKSKFRDDIQFGEIIHRPPQLTVRPKYAGQVDKPGKKDNLLLQKMLVKNGRNQLDNKKSFSKSPAARKKEEEQRELAVQMYRLMKKNKLQTKN